MKIEMKVVNLSNEKLINKIKEIEKEKVHHLELNKIKTGCKEETEKFKGYLLKILIKKLKIL